MDMAWSDDKDDIVLEKAYFDTNLIDMATSWLQNCPCGLIFLAHTMLSSANWFEGDIGMVLYVSLFLWSTPYDPCISGRKTQGIDTKLDLYIPRAWLIWGRVPANSCHFHAFDWLCSFRAFPDEPIKGVVSNLVGTVPGHTKPKPPIYPNT